MSAPTLSSVPSDLATRLFTELARKPKQRVQELAQALKADRRDIARCMVQELAGKVEQDLGYAWSLRPGVTPPDMPASAALPLLSSTHQQLFQYYLECLGQDSDEGVSVFAAAKYGDPDYAELPALPLAAPDKAWAGLLSAQRVLRKVKGDKANLVAWVGYPVRLRKHRSATWEGFFVEPVLLWPVEIPEGEGAPRISEEFPVINFAFLKNLVGGDSVAMLEEAARLDAELGRNLPLDQQPDAEELLQRLPSIRPEWGWQEPLTPNQCSTGITLATLQNQGIYNRAVLLPGKRSPYTQGLEGELTQLAGLPELAFTDTCLGEWLAGQATFAVPSSQEPLLEVAPMNLEQRAAVRSALSEPLTVVTGPPGTGKSQIVTNLLINAAWRGMKVLFASKNNKAVDVVETRVNALGPRPVLLRLGANEHQTRLSNYLTNLLSGTISSDDERSYHDRLARHRALASQLESLDEAQASVLRLRNQVDALEQEVEGHRGLLGVDRFNALSTRLLDEFRLAKQNYLAAIESLDPAHSGGLGRLVQLFTHKAQLQTLAEARMELAPIAEHLGVSLPMVSEEAALGPMRTAAKNLNFRVEAAQAVRAYQRVLNELREHLSLEDIARTRKILTAQIAENSVGLWADWVKIAPARLSAEQRKTVADYATVLQLLSGPNASAVNSAVRAKAAALQLDISALFSCWAVTSLSVRGKLPFEPGVFDLVVIDEASQCDIASALPLLFRAKRAVIIGDPKQLKHISSLTRQKESELQQKYALLANRMSWAYSVNSLYDLATSLASSANLITLRDHHRSHPDIIGFSNEHFYEGRLRVATGAGTLLVPEGLQPGIYWDPLTGMAVKPPEGGLYNPPEATAIIKVLQDILLNRKFTGTVGVVTPFRAQAQLIQKKVAERNDLAARGVQANLVVDTVHKFQGDERDVLIFSPVVGADTPSSALAFLQANDNLFNVAITRARGLLYIVGDPLAAVNCPVPYLSAFAAYAAQLAQLEAPPTRGLGQGRPERLADWDRVLHSALTDARINVIPHLTVEQYDIDLAVIEGERKLAIEIDSEHYHTPWTADWAQRDQLRSQRLLELGWEVLRFWVYDLRDRLPECVRQIQEWRMCLPNN